MKLNNKGYLLVEMIVCSVITFAIAYFLIDITVNFKNKYEVVFYENKYNVDSVIINKNIMDDIEKYSLKKVDFQSDANQKIANFTFLIDDKEVLKKLTLLQVGNNVLYKYGVYTASGYDISKYYYEKEISGLNILGMDIYNECYGNAVKSGKICVENTGYTGEVLLKNAKLTISFLASSIFLGDYAIDIIVPYNNFETIVIPEVPLDKSGASVPMLASGMIPVTFDEVNKVWIKADARNYDINYGWYDYSIQKWANAVTVSSATRDTYMTSDVGTTIVSTDILAHYVWIPRFRYKIFNASFTAGTLPDTIDIVFESVSTPKSTGGSNGTYLTHPAFTYGGKELPGIWVGKFEITGSTTTPTILPSKVSLKNVSIPLMNEKIRMFGSFNHLTNQGTKQAEAHLIKNMEWGAIAYLSYSKYGINTEINQNTNSSYYTGGGGSNAYINNFLQSTTGNVYGIYDMVGGAWEYVMGNYNRTVGSSSLQTMRDNKYYDVYTGTSIAYSKLGDALGETAYWHNDAYNFVYSSNPWFVRGYNYSATESAGIFSFSYTNGAANESFGFRNVLVVEEEPVKPEANAPELADSMIPVTFDGTNWIKTSSSNLNNSWYDYYDLKWANAVLVNNTTRDTYMSAPLGTVIASSDVLAYYVWIPRYKYKLFNTGFVVGDMPNTIDIIFEKGVETTGTGTTEGSYLTHPAFTYDGKALKGFWVSKFEVTGSATAPTSLPNVAPLTNLYVSQMHTTTKLFQTNNYFTGKGMKQIDPHMIKNMEWGAIAYLSQSAYGKKYEVAQNTNSNYRTGGGNYINNVLQSTTGNITGVYDMVGGAWDYVMGNYNNTQASSGFVVANLARKYIDIYTGTSLAYSKRGDALGETAYLYGDSYNFIYSTNPWLVRGYNYSSTTAAGIFSFSYTSGAASESFGFRNVLTVDLVEEEKTKPNAPELTQGMIPITYNGSSWVKANSSNPNNSWYNYDSQKWANAVLVTEATRNTYMNATAGTVISEADILAYLVWIPRYKYKLFNTSFSTSTIPDTIDIVFESGTAKTGTGGSNGTYLTHPAFTLDGVELKGIWVGKFETTGTSSSPTVKPGKVSLRNLNVSQMHTSSKYFQTSRYVSNESVEKLDAHMMKNMEWGAVAYLSHSLYGTNSEIAQNTNSSYYTGGGSGNAYLSRVNQSTTGNVTGIYDMSGGAYEYVMGNYNKTVGSSGFGALQNSKYIDNYGGTSIAYSKLGDALGETTYWYGDTYNFVYSSNPWFVRGYAYNGNPAAGIFGYSYTSGGANENFTYRLVLSYRKVDETVKNEANAPVLADSMIPVVYDEANGVWKKANSNNTNNSWYNYNDKKWANVVLVSEATRNSYIKASVGTTITSTDILAYFVWIPRFKYKLFNAGFALGNLADTIDVRFEIGTATTGTGTTNGSWLTHPAFTYNGKQLKGIWVSKFETTGTATNPTVLPNAVSLKGINIYTMHETAKLFQTNKYFTNQEVSKVDAHIMKNSDWGAVSYLANSIYGINSEVLQNTNSSYKTGGGNYIAYVNQSTTYNVTGVYDMSGGAYEYVMGNYGSRIGSAGFTVLPSNNYLELYSGASIGYSHLGDATGETANWNGDSYDFISSSYPWFVRGYTYSSSTVSGTFSYTYNSGGASGAIGFRTVIVVSEEEKDTTPANAPELASGMIPVSYNGSAWVKADLNNSNNSWYDYYDLKWANAVLVSSSTRDTYMKASVGTPVLEADILGYFVWIPRYKYKLFNASLTVGTVPEQIDIMFESGIAKTGTGSSNGSYLTHPSFTFGDKELTGFWISKFEMTGSANAPTAKPNSTALLSLNISQLAEKARMFGNSNYLTGKGSFEVDAHMIKNSEWGAVAYLSRSLFGKNYEVAQNTNSGYKTGGGNYISNVLQSTTGNITGVYDMAGGAYEFVMGNYANKPGSSGYSVIATSKYIDIYSGTSIGYSKLGHALGETAYWYLDSYDFVPSATYPWFIRGYAYSSTTAAGIFNYSYNSGAAASNITSRAVMAIMEDETRPEANKPELADSMIPVSYNGSAWVKADTNNANNSWYDYNNALWANAVLVSEATRSAYMEAPTGTTITATDILGYFVWIPRYKYQLFNASYTAGTMPNTINIAFESGTASTGTVKCSYSATGSESCSNKANGNWYTHPAFTFDGKELSGIWVAKFEATGSATTPTSLPGKVSLKSINVYTMHETAKLFQTTKYLSSVGTSQVNSHMAKNSEWGAVAYLSHSKYGKNSEIIQNVNSSYYTGGGSGNAYVNNVLQSTTGNITGIYDMSGGAYEYVMGNYNIKSGSSGFTQFPSAKYFDTYYSTSIGYSHLGDALGETAYWYNDSYDFVPSATYPWFIRGYAYSSSTAAGIFSYTYTSGGAGSNITFRPVLTVTEVEERPQANAPVLADSMIPVSYNGSAWVKANSSNTNNTWYDYNSQRWANAVLVSSATRDTYMKASVGTQVTEADILAYYVWIPRYKYKLFNTAYTAGTVPDTIDIIFESGKAKTGTGSSNGTYLTHPAFTLGTDELEGIWVGKFETTGSETNPTIKPNSTSLKNLTVAKFAENAKLFGSTNYLSAKGAREVDAHMAKNSEWGAVAYLSHSLYGKNYEVAQNTNSSYKTGGNNYVANVLQSTTGNITGVYDMSGGSYEYVMGNYANKVGSSGLSSVDSSKYVDIYSGTSIGYSKLGHALGETAYWYLDSYDFVPSATYPWFIRGYTYSSSTAAGIFGYTYTTGGNGSNITYRSVLTIGEDSGCDKVTVNGDNSVNYAGAKWYKISEDSSSYTLVLAENYGTGDYGNYTTITDAYWSTSRIKKQLDEYLSNSGIDTQCLVKDAKYGYVRAPYKSELSASIPNDSKTPFWTMNYFDNYYVVVGKADGTLYEGWNDIDDDEVKTAVLWGGSAYSSGPHGTASGGQSFVWDRYAVTSRSYGPLRFNPYGSAYNYNLTSTVYVGSGGTEKTIEDNIDCYDSTKGYWSYSWYTSSYSNSTGRVTANVCTEAGPKTVYLCQSVACCKYGSKYSSQSGGSSSYSYKDFTYNTYTSCTAKTEYKYTQVTEDIGYRPVIQVYKD